jgi:hypothetical protein
VHVYIPRAHKVASHNNITVDAMLARALQHYCYREVKRLKHKLLLLLVLLSLLLCCNTVSYREY